MRLIPCSHTMMAICLIGALPASSAFAHGTHGTTPQAVSADLLAAAEAAPSPEARWLSGDHHVHSRFSVGMDTKTTPPTPVMGADAAYPIPMNAVMGRRFGLSWMVSTDHGGPDHSKINHDHAYPELQQSRQAVPDLIQFFGMEFNSPGADHSSIIVPAGADEPGRLQAIEQEFDAKEAFPLDPARNTERRMIEALKVMNAQSPKPVLFAHHPSRSATGLGEYGMTAPAELRVWNDTAPEVAIGMEGSPGHQAAAQMRQRFQPSPHEVFFKDQPRGAYGKYPTMGGYDQMTARLGGFWDSMLGEGRRWWITANSDSHIHWSDGGADFWPGEYSKTYVLAEKDHDAILAGMRAGRIFVTTGDLITRLDVTASAGSAAALTGGKLAVARGANVTVTIRLHDPQTPNANGDNPAVARVDLIRGKVTGTNPVSTADSNPTTRIEARFGPGQWTREGDDIIISHVLKQVSGDEYIRVRGTNTAELEPQPDGQSESPWSDLWFYSNPIFLVPAPRR